MRHSELRAVPAHDGPSSAKAASCASHAARMPSSLRCHPSVKLAWPVQARHVRTRSRAALRAWQSCGFEDLGDLGCSALKTSGVYKLEACREASLSASYLAIAVMSCRQTGVCFIRIDFV